MKKNGNLNLKYIFAGVASLVLMLAVLMFSASLHRENSDRLFTTIQNLSNNYNREQKIDSIIELLYNADNNARMYAIHSDSTYYNLYTHQLELIDSLVQSMQKDSGDIGLIKNINDKQLKTQLFIKTRLLIDSLLLYGANNKIYENKSSLLKFKKYVLHPKTETYVRVDTVKLLQSKKAKKGFFARIGAAIRNRQDTGNVNYAVNSAGKQNNSAADSLSTQMQSDYVIDSIFERRQNDILVADQADLQKKEAILLSLQKREKSLLESNSKLFTSLLNLLQQIKQGEKIMEQQRDVELSISTNALIHNLRFNYHYIIAFSILLSLIILAALYVLYKYEVKLQKAKQEAEDFAQQKSEFAATISHEIRNSVYSINSYTDELANNLKPSNQSEAISAIKVSSSMLQEVVNNVLDLSKIEKGRFQINVQPFNPKTIITEMLSGFAIHIRQKNLSSSYRIDESADRIVYGDAFYLRQILLNLLSNTIKYTQKGNISVEASITPLSNREVSLHVAVSDTGIGISEKDLPHIFEAFYNSQNKTNAVASSGFGLSIVKKIIDLQNASITVTSKVNEGSTFSLTIPYATKIDKPITKKQINSAEDLKILLVENEKIIQMFLSKTLQACGYTLQIMNDAESALQWLDGNIVDLILTDMGLPKMNGCTFAEKVKTLDSSNAAVPIFCLTGYKDEIDVPKNTFNEWLVKPFKPEVLLQKINEYFEVIS